MVYKKKKYGKRKYNTYKRRRTYPSRVPRPPISKNYARFKLSMAAPNSFTSTGGSTLALRMSLSNPQRGMNINSTGYTTMQEWTDITQLYDQYKVTYVKIKYFPAAPNSTSIIFGNFNIFHDLDDADNSDATVAEALTNNHVQVKQLDRPWVYKARVSRKFVSGGTGSAPVNAGWFDTAALPQIGAVKGISTGLTASTLYGYIVCNMWIKCRDRR